MCVGAWVRSDVRVRVLLMRREGDLMCSARYGYLLCEDLVGSRRQKASREYRQLKRVKSSQRARESLSIAMTSFCSSVYAAETTVSDGATISVVSATKSEVSMPQLALAVAVVTYRPPATIINHEVLSKHASHS